MLLQVCIHLGQAVTSFLKAQSKVFWQSSPNTLDVYGETLLGHNLEVVGFEQGEKSNAVFLKPAILVPEFEQTHDLTSSHILRPSSDAASAVRLAALAQFICKFFFGIRLELLATALGGFLALPILKENYFLPSLEKTNIFDLITNLEYWGFLVSC